MEAGPCFTVGSKGDLSLRNGACKCPRQAGIPRTTNLKIALKFKTTWSSLLSPDPSRNAKTKCTRTLNPFFFKPVRRRLERKIWSFYGLRRRRWLVAWQANTQQRSNVSAGRQCYRCMMRWWPWEWMEAASGNLDHWHSGDLWTCRILRGELATAIFSKRPYLHSEC